MQGRGNSQQIVLVDDEMFSARVLQHQLERRGYLCQIILSGSALLEYLATGQRPDIFLLDYFLGLDEPTGLALCRRIRALDATPVIMLTGNGEIDTLVACLKAGADQYIVKPCDIRELEARITAALRRSSPSAGEGPARIRALEEGISLDWQARRVHSDDGLCTQLTEKEMALLELFVSSPDRRIDRADAFQAIYGFALPPDNRSIDVLVSKLRRKLAVLDSRCTISATRGQGYLLSLI
jgi:DNA-binding response OmpR family regulator